MKRIRVDDNGPQMEADRDYVEPKVESQSMNDIAAKGEQPSADAASPSIAALQERAAALEDSLLRVKADYQNAQRRAMQERLEAIRYANAELMRSLVPILDDLERALAFKDDPSERASLRDGVQLVYENLAKALHAQGLEPISALHQPFDPHVHEAMMRLPSTDHPAGTVVEELAKGYRLHDRTLRPAKVVVAGDAQDLPA